MLDSVSSLSRIPTVGMISSRIDFDPGDSVTRDTFGLMTWAVTRQGLLKGGLYDENFYPGCALSILLVATFS